MPTRGKVILAGGSGFLGQALVAALATHGYDPVILSRAPSNPTASPRTIHWDARTPGPWCAELNNTLAIMNFVGRSVDCRKTPANKRFILESRVHSVEALGAALHTVPNPPKIWLQTGTAHIYGDTDDQLLDESSPTGTGLAPDVGRAWEAALDAVHLQGLRKVNLRISFVLGRNGGALKTLARLTRLGLGGTVGTGRQYISWIHIDDLTQIFLRALETPTMSGTYVTTAPNPVPNAAFMRALRQATHRPWSPPTPAPLVRLASIFLRTDPDLALLGRRCIPSRLQSEAYTFRFPDLTPALTDLLRKRAPSKIP